MTKKVALGHRVREITTGLEGVVIAMTEFLTGNVQFTIQPPGKDGVCPDSFGYDDIQLTYLDDGIAERVVAAPARTDIILGEKVQDIVTGLEGIAVRKATFMNGCIYYEVQGRVNAESVARADFIEFKRLKAIGDGVVDAIAAKTEGVKPAGGPRMPAVKRG